MNTARIVVLAIAIGAGGVAAHLASGSGNKPAPAASIAQLPTVDVLVAKSETDDRQAGTLSLALRSIADVNMVENVTDITTPGRGVNIIRFGVPSLATLKK